MDLREPVELNAVLESAQLYHTEKGLKTVLVVDAKLTAEMAVKLGCPELYTKNGVPREWFQGVELPGEANDFDLYLPDGEGRGDRQMLIPELAYKFKVARAEGDEVGLRLKFRVHMFGGNFDAGMFLMQMAGGEFTMTMQPRQGTLALQAEATGGDVNPVTALPTAREMGVTRKKRKQAAEEETETVVN